MQEITSFLSQIDKTVLFIIGSIIIVIIILTIKELSRSLMGIITAVVLAGVGLPMIGIPAIDFFSKFF